MGSAVDLYWLPLGAGGHCVRWNGRAYEAFAAMRSRRRRQDLYHSALEVRIDEQTYVVEMAPVWNLPTPDRGVVIEGPVGAAALGRWRAFRYEVRRWAGGQIPDVASAVDSPVRVADDRSIAINLLGLVPTVPALTWGRDQLHMGEMWNSNSLTAWLLTKSGVATDCLHPPRRGRAPGWEAGRRVALTDTTSLLRATPAFP